MADVAEKKTREFPGSTFGFGPGPYLFGGEKGLEVALIVEEKYGTNWLQMFTSGKSSYFEEGS